jgi:two-component system sensor histidine kinase ChiS
MLALSLPLSSQAASSSLVYEPGAKPLLLSRVWEKFAGLLEDSALPVAGESLPRLPLEASLAELLRSPQGGERGDAATYRLKLFLGGSSPRLYSLYLPAAADYRSVSVNGQLLHRRGDSSTATEFQFTAAPGPLSIVVQSAAGDVRPESPGLIPRFILFGEAGALQRYRVAAICLAFVQVGFFLLAGVFTLFLFMSWRKNREFLGFGLFMLAAGLFSLVRVSALFGLLSPLMDLAESLYVAALNLQLLSLVYFIATLFPGRIKRPWRFLLYLPSLLVGALSLVFRPEARLFYLASLILYAVSFVLAALLLLRIALKGDRRAGWLLPFLLLAVTLAALPRFLSEVLGVTLFLEPAGFIVMALASMLFLVKKVGDSFDTLESLSGYADSVATTMKRFIPTEFLECLNKNDILDLRLGDHVKKDMTIFFSDIRSFTELSERLTVEENFAFINSYLARVVPLVNENGGFVDKYIGDGIMALFAGSGGADAAIRTAIQMQAKIVEYNGHRAKMGYRPIGMGVGIHTGALMLGVIGVDDRMENTVISDAVNLSSRLQAITKAFNISLAISEQSFKELADPGVYKYRFIGKVKVKGKAAPVSVFEIFDGIAPELFERKMKANTFFEQGMLAYYQKEFGDAMYYFKRVLEVIPEDGAASFYLENCIDKAGV